MGTVLFGSGEKPMGTVLFGSDFRNQTEPSPLVFAKPVNQKEPSPMVSIVLSWAYIGQWVICAAAF